MHKKWKLQLKCTIALMAQQVQREDANQPTVEAEGGILNPEHSVDPSWLEGTNGVDGTADKVHDDAIGALSRQTLSERDISNWCRA